MSVIKTIDLSAEDLHAYFNEHIRYEMQHLLNATDAIDRRFSIQNGLQYMVLESFVIHLRNLITFLYPYTKRDEDVCAEDYYMNSKTWSHLHPQISTILSQAKTRADKEVGHLTTSRQFGTPKSKIWKVVILTDEIMPILKLFCGSADKADLNKDFEPIWKQYTDIKEFRISR